MGEHEKQLESEVADLERRVAEAEAAPPPPRDDLEPFRERLASAVRSLTSFAERALKPSCWNFMIKLGFDLTSEGREELGQSPKWLDRTDDGTVLDVFERKRETDRTVDRILVAPRKLSSGLLDHFSRAVKVDRWDPATNRITGTDATTNEAVSIRAATASDYAESYMNKYQYPHQEDRLRRAEERFTKMDRFGAIQEGKVVVLRNVRGVAYDGPPAVGIGGIKEQRSIPMFEQSEMLSDEVAIEINRRLEARKPQEAPTPKPDLKPAPSDDWRNDPFR